MGDQRVRGCGMNAKLPGLERSEFNAFRSAVLVFPIRLASPDNHRETPDNHVETPDNHGERPDNHGKTSVDHVKPSVDHG
jgi:hypothetical protein